MKYDFEKQSEKLDTELKRVIDITNKKEPIYLTPLTILYNTGCRANEMFDIKRWKIDRKNKNIIKLQPSKFSNGRTFNKSEIPLKFIDSINESYNCLHPVNYERLNRWFLKICDYAGIKKLNKYISLHLFRYNYVNRLYYSGITEESIIELVGWKNDKTLKSYLSLEYIKNYLSLH